MSTRLLGQTVPHPNKVRWEGLGLTPREAFVLSQIDGVLCLDEVAEISGMPVDAVCAITERLEVLGAVSVPGRGRPVRGNEAGRYATHGAPAPTTKETRRTRKPPKRASSAPDEARTPSSPPSSRRGRSEAPVRPEKARGTARPTARAASARPEARPTRPAKSRVDGVSALDLQLLEAKNHYGVLGVPRTASTAEISRAHAAREQALPEGTPDHLRARLREAHDVLSDAARRAEYDQYLALTRTSMRMERALAPILEETPAVVARPVLTVRGEGTAPTPPHAPPRAPRVEEEPDVVVEVVGTHSEPPPIASEPPAAAVPTAVMGAGVGPSSPVPAMPAPPLEAPAAAPAAASPSPEPPASSAPSAAASPAPSPPSPPPAPPAPSPPPSASAPEAARRPRKEDRATAVLRAAQQALIAGDAVAAANHYRLALEFAEDASARGYAESGLREARAMLFDLHVKKGRYEEKEQHWPEAVATYEKAIALRPDDAAICDRLANALRQVGTDLERALQLAETAVTRAPRRASYRTTLGLVHAAAGARSKAVDQLERALVLDPDDATARHALEALRRRR